MRGERNVHKVFLGLGSNLGDRQAHLTQAISLIAEKIGPVIRQSSFIETEPWGFESENKFLNGVILVETTLTPRQLLMTTQMIERALGRKKHISHLSPPSQSSPIAPSSQLPLTSRLYKDRPIDIDILLYDDLIVDEPDLKIPHPLMHERDFVMIPLEEIRNADITK